MKSFDSFLSVASVLIFAAALSACASQVPTRSGFLQDYEGITTHDNAKSRLEAWSETARWTDYNKIVLDQVVLHLPAQSVHNLSAEEKVTLQVQATSTLAEAFGSKVGTTVNTNASGQLRVRAAITGIDLSNPAINVVSALTLIAPLDNGGVTVEIEIVDERTQKVMHRRVVAMNGKIYWVLGSFEKTGHTRAALEKIFDDLAADLANRCGCHFVQASVTQSETSG